VEAYDDEVDIPGTRDEQTVMLAPLVIAHRDKSTRQLMVAERQALLEILDKRVAATSTSRWQRRTTRSTWR
jgi:hypothetical protein